MLYVITGRAAAGKTTTAMAMIKKMKAEGRQPVLIDGDDFRSFFPSGYSEHEREEHITRMSKFAKLITNQGIDVIIAAILPKVEWRCTIRNAIQPNTLIFIRGGFLWAETEYDEPTMGELQSYGGNYEIIDGNIMNDDEVSNVKSARPKPKIAF